MIEYDVNEENSGVPQDLARLVRAQRGEDMVLDYRWTAIDKVGEWTERKSITDLRSSLDSAHLGDQFHRAMTVAESGKIRVNLLIELDPDYHYGLSPLVLPRLCQRLADLQRQGVRFILSPTRHESAQALYQTYLRDQQVRDMSWIKPKLTKLDRKAESLAQIYSGILPSIGGERATHLSRRFPSLYHLAKATVKELQSEMIGASLALKLYNFIRGKHGS